MVQREDQNKKIVEDIKSAWEEGDLLKLIRAGFDSFLNMAYHNNPLPFQKFLEYTGAFFDQYILDVTKKEQLSYVGGKMILALGQKTKDGFTIIHLSANFYFQTPNKQWIVKKKTGQVDSSRFTDWATDSDAVKLKKSRKLELSIEPPNPEAN